MNLDSDPATTLFRSLFQESYIKWELEGSSWAIKLRILAWSSSLLISSTLEYFLKAFFLVRLDILSTAAITVRAKYHN